MPSHTHSFITIIELAGLNGDLEAAKDERKNARDLLEELLREQECLLAQIELKKQRDQLAKEMVELEQQVQDKKDEKKKLVTDLTAVKREHYHMQKAAGLEQNYRNGHELPRRPKTHQTQSASPPMSPTPRGRGGLVMPPPSPSVRRTPHSPRRFFNAAAKRASPKPGPKDARRVKQLPTFIPNLG
jgi:hypothetical protein